MGRELGKSPRRSQSLEGLIPTAIQSADEKAFFVHKSCLMTDQDFFTTQFCYVAVLREPAFVSGCPHSVRRRREKQISEISCFEGGHNEERMKT